MKRRMLFILEVGCFVLLAKSTVCQQPNDVGHVQRASLQGVAAGKTSPPEPSWTVQYTTGSLAAPPTQWLRIAFLPLVVAQSKSNLVMNVPADRFVRVEYDTKAENEALGIRTGCGYALNMMPDISMDRPASAVAALVMVGRVSRLNERLNRRHAVRLVWNESGKEQSMTVRVNACEYRSFIANTKWLLGARWHDVALGTNR